MNTDYDLLVEKEEIWAKMLIQVLRNNAIFCTAVPVYGAGLVTKAGLQERLKIYVANEDMPKARELLDGFFPAEKT